ncbi:MAG TPA: YceI family protein [bacterium]|nr:YceI family protein [bacterium]
MNELKLSLLMMAGLLVLSSPIVSADQATPAATPKSGFSGNQLMANAQPPITQRPASVVGPVKDIAAPQGGSLLTLQKGSVLYLAGDSTLHKFEIGAKALQGSAALKASGDLAKALKKDGVAEMALVVPVTQLKSKESGLDDNAYKALKAKENPEIKFVLKSETLASGKMTASGNLTVAGVTVPVTLNAEAAITGDQIRLKGVQKLKMTDFQVKPPSISLLVTSIDCKDDIEIHYDVIFGSAK